MNNKGLTLVELIVTFALAITIIIILINTLIIIKKNYEETDTKTNLIVNQSTLSNMLNTRFQDDNLESYTTCSGTFCYSFKFKGEDPIELKINNNIITFGRYTYKLDSNSRVENPTLNYDSPYIHLVIPIKNKLFPNENFGINLVYKRV